MSVLHNMMIADRIVSLGLLAAGLSHHIRNALVAVKTFLDLAPAKLKEESVDISGLRNPDFWKDYYQNVQGQIEKINGMLKDLWVASENPAYTFKDQVRLRQVVGDVVDKLKDAFAAKNIRVENNVPEQLPVMTVDRPKLYRLFELLLKDEAVSLPAGSHVSISAELEEGATPGRVQVQVKDNGPGLPQEALRVIFDPFMVRSDSPLEYGINLMACFFIVHHHGGKIEARSEQGQGTTFTIRLLTNSNQPSQMEEGQDFVQKIFLNDTIWEKLIAAA
jgi:two-component system, probable response regulator PhcQ